MTGKLVRRLEKPSPHTRPAGRLGPRCREATLRAAAAARVRVTCFPWTSRVVMCGAMEEENLRVNAAPERTASLGVPERSKKGKHSEYNWRELVLLNVAASTGCWPAVRDAGVTLT